jgi:hypothetical protein
VFGRRNGCHKDSLFKQEMNKEYKEYKEYKNPMMITSFRFVCALLGTLIRGVRNPTSRM